MPDVGLPPDGPVAHLATPQWQSFEIRMRARKAEKCLDRAAAALDLGSIDGVSEAIEEARRLSPTNPRVEELSTRLDALKEPALEIAPAQGHGYVWKSAAIIAGLVVLSGASWEAWTHRDQLAMLAPKAHPDTDTAGLASPTPAGVPTTDLARPNGAAPPATQTASPETTVDLQSAAAAAGGDANTATAAPSAATSDTVVQTTLVRPEMVIDTRSTPSAPPPSHELGPVATAGTDKRSETNVDAPRPPVTPNASEPGARPSQRETAPAPPPSPEYRPPSVLPATPAPSPAANFIPSVMPPESSRPNTVTNASTANAPSDALAPPSSAVLPPAPTTSALPAASTPARDDRVAIRTALSRYESAYNRLDVEAVRTIWPSLDERALSRAFDSLTAQRVSLQNCNFDVKGSSARASCSGNASWTPKVGGGERSASRNWTFDLSEANGAWRITRVMAR